METYTTKGFSALPDADEQRSNGCPDAFFIQNESATIELEATTGEIEAFSEDSGIEIDSDVIADGDMIQLIEFLNLKRHLDAPLAGL